MKKHLLIIISIFICSTGAMAQTSGKAPEQSYNSGDNLLNVGIGLGSPFFGSGYSASIPVNPSISYERGITDAISVGGILSYASSKFNYVGFGGTYSFKLNATYIGARGSYHFNDLLDLDSKFDVYGGASLGYVIVSASDNTGGVSAVGSGAGLGVFAGGKYYFQPKIGVYAEAGYQSLSLLNVGITFKL